MLHTCAKHWNNFWASVIYIVIVKFRNVFKKLLECFIFLLNLWKLIQFQLFVAEHKSVESSSCKRKQIHKFLCFSLWLFITDVWCLFMSIVHVHFCLFAWLWNADWTLLHTENTILSISKSFFLLMIYEMLYRFFDSFWTTCLSFVESLIHCWPK